MLDPGRVSAALQWQGGRAEKPWIFLSPLVTYDLPSQFTHPQELASNMVKGEKN
jgi:hypothetical protein